MCAPEHGESPLDSNELHSNVLANDMPAQDMHVLSTSTSSGLVTNGTVTVPELCERCPGQSISTLQPTICSIATGAPDSTSRRPPATATASSKAADRCYTHRRNRKKEGRKEPETYGHVEMGDVGSRVYWTGESPAITLGSHDSPRRPR